MKSDLESKKKNFENFFEKKKIRVTEKSGVKRLTGGYFTPKLETYRSSNFATRFWAQKKKKFQNFFEKNEKWRAEKFMQKTIFFLQSENALFLVKYPPVKRLTPDLFIS